jgi:hypothetical protein
MKNEKKKNKKKPPFLPQKKTKTKQKTTKLSFVSLFLIEMTVEERCIAAILVWISLFSFWLLFFFSFSFRINLTCFFFFFFFCCCCWFVLVIVIFISAFWFLAPLVPQEALLDHESLDGFCLQPISFLRNHVPGSGKRPFRGCTRSRHSQLVPCNHSDLGKLLLSGLPPHHGIALDRRFFTLEKSNQLRESPCSLNPEHIVLPHPHPTLPPSRCHRSISILSLLVDSLNIMFHDASHSIQCEREEGERMKDIIFPFFG